MPDSRRMCSAGEYASQSLPTRATSRASPWMSSRTSSGSCLQRESEKRSTGALRGHGWMLLRAASHLLLRIRCVPKAECGRVVGAESADQADRVARGHVPQRAEGGVRRLLRRRARVQRRGRAVCDDDDKGDPPRVRYPPPVLLEARRQAMQPLRERRRASWVDAMKEGPQALAVVSTHRANPILALY
eukprot:1162150-Prymnesium_polylepis.1